MPPSWRSRLLMSSLPRSQPMTCLRSYRYTRPCLGLGGSPARRFVFARWHRPTSRGLFWRGRRGELVGAVLQSPVAIGEEPGAWLGPIAVTADGRRAGVGAALMARAIARDAESGDRFVMLIGDESYYGRFGFKVVAPGSIQIPGPADPKRLLAVSLTPLPILPVGGGPTALTLARVGDLTHTGPHEDLCRCRCLPCEG